ncbi:MAG: hypothetical protein JO027_21240 [Solirubrobacterales bacterium]|nr:hypothetical protein [Solirubrobacterales bacterium]
MSRFLTPPRRVLAFGRVVALIVAYGVAVVVGGCGGSSTPAAPLPTRTQPLQTIFEAQTELFAAPAPTLDLLKHLGVDAVKVFMPWSELAPDPLSHSRPAFDATSPAAYAASGWAPFDTIIRDAAQRHIAVDLALEAPAPLWATGPGIPPGTSSGFVGAWRPVAHDFGLFVAAVGTRYSGHYTPPGGGSPLPKVDFWSIWNEPNYGQQLAPQAIDSSTVEVSPALYRRLLDAAWSALGQTGHAHDRVLIGEIAPRGLTLGDQPGNFSGMVPLRFIRALYCVDSTLHPLTGAAAIARSCPSTQAGSTAFPSQHPGLFQAAGFAFHPYPQQYAPNVGTPDGLGADYADLPQLGKLERTLDGAFAAYGSNARLVLYDTEFGYQTNPPETIIRAISPKLAAAYSNQAEYMSWRDPRVVTWDQYLLADPPSGLSSFDTGIELAGGAPKQPLYDAFRMPLYLPVTTTSSNHPIEVWGCVRPAHYVMLHSRIPQTVQIQLQRTPGGRFETVTRERITDPDGYFDTRVAFPASGLVRISWAYPHRQGGNRIYSRTVQVSIR